ncbi:hypothetical protein D3C85_761320 [compost metagenome]
MLDAAVLGHFTQHAAIAATNDQHALGGAVGQDRHVGEHFVVDEFVGFGGLDHAVQRHHPAHARVFENHQVLVLGTHFVQQLVHAKTLAVAFVEGFQVLVGRVGAHGKSPGECWWQRTVTRP